ncbi:histidine-phosphotransfer domain, HPT domain-containing protein [Phialemonium atrogriseum]|uniref:Histidine-phosphotransfer domain, HPT domain-containing protein n=1 Tax=Phialemonium atrogriseum TaxID=1093897 RepID=A0AAJ0C9N9_9PEZI|nr:histidine-phosphotransfer domain, HPT domain-containing protein [Phialemonium atrogriseum]KAK1772546.1 histidine-phosphotransfer domain, HPT domain-containing protein [Phialemonium atrogriseum]
MLDFGDSVDLSTFSQILEMDDSEEEREFSKPLVLNFFEQAEETFAKMDNALRERNLSELSSLGHFLKGSSATLGFLKVRDSCQVIQQYGHNLNLDGSPEADQAVCLYKISEALKTVKTDTADLEVLLKEFFKV